MVQPLNKTDLYSYIIEYKHFILIIVILLPVNHIYLNVIKSILGCYAGN